MHTFFQKIIFIGICLLIGIYGYSQESWINNRLNIQLGYNSKNEFYQAFYKDFKMQSIYSQVTYGYGNYFESGIYAGKTVYKDVFEHFKTSYKYLGITQKIQVLPLFFNISNCRFDIYIPLSIGFSYMLYPFNVFPNIRTNQYSLGIGLSTHIIKNFGFFTEFSYNNKVQEEFKPYLQFGLSYVWQTKPKTTPEQ